MKKAKKLIPFLIIVLILLSSCDNLSGPAPQGSINVESLNNITKFKALLSGAYNGLQNYGSGVIFWDASMTAYVKGTVDFVTLRQISSQQMAPNNGVITGFWNQMYKSINELNIIIAKLPKLKGADQSAIDNVLGQAYFLRALLYYYLVKFYALPWGAKPDNSQMGVPLKLKPVLSTNDFHHLKRASVKDVYAQINKDLQTAHGLNITNTSPAMGTNGAVTALRARIALIQENWTNAAQFAGDVISSGNYKLLAKVTTYFQNELSAGSIFEIVNSSNDNPGDGNTSISTLYNLKGRPGAQLGSAFKADLKKVVTPAQKAALNTHNMTAVDTRVTELLSTKAKPPLTIDDYTHTNKYEDAINHSDNDPIIRFPEMILTRAYALAEINGNNLSKDTEAITLLNEIRKRAIIVKKPNGSKGDESLIEYSAADFQTQQQLLDAISLSRSITLSFEGHRKTDLQRRHKNVDGTRGGR